MGYVMAAEQAVDPGSSGELAFGLLTVVIAVVAVAIPVGLLVGVLVLAGRVRRHGDRLAQVEARLAAAEGRQTVGQ